MSRTWARSAIAIATAWLALVALYRPVAAQEGYPLDGTWIGTWKANAVHGDDVFLVLSWDGRHISGTINPGTDDMPITSASLDPQGWVVHIEAAGKDKSGRTLHYAIDGKIEHLELANRSIVGTWKSEAGAGAFEAARQ